MPQVLIRSTGQPAQVSDIELPALLASGRASLGTGVVNLKGTGGELYGMRTDDPQLVRVLASGARLETPNELNDRILEKKYGDSPVRTFLEGAARTGTFNLSDLLLTAETPWGQLTTPEALAGRKRFNETAATLGEAAPLVGSVLGGIGKGAVAGFGKFLEGPVVSRAFKLSEAIGAKSEAQVASLLGGTEGLSPLAKTLSKAAGVGARGVVDGALFGAGELVSEHALGDPNLNGERVARELGVSILMGGAFGLGMEGVLGLGRAGAVAARDFLIKNVEKIPLSQQMRDFATQRTVDAYSLKTAGIKQLQKQGLYEISARAVHDLPHPDGDVIFKGSLTPEQRINRLIEATNAYGDAVKSFGLDDKISALSHDQLADKLEKELVYPLRTVRTPQDIMRGAENMVERIRQMPKDDIRNVLMQAGEKEVLEAFEKGADVNILKGFLMQQGKADVVAELNRIAENKVTFAELQQLRNGFRDAYRAANPSNYLPTKAKDVMPKLERFFNAEQEKIAKQFLDPEQMSHYLDVKNAFWSLKTLSDEAAARLNTVRGNNQRGLTASIVGATGTGGVLGSLLSQGAGVLPAVGKAAVLGEIMAGIRNQLQKRGPGMAAAFFDRVSKMMDIERMVNAAKHAEDEAAAKMASGLTSTSAGAGEAAVKASPQDALRSAGRFKAIVNDPERLQRLGLNIDDHMSDVAPQIAAAVSNRLVEIASFLAAKAPREPTPDMVAPKSQAPWLPSQQQAFEYQRYINAAYDPLSVFRQLAAGVPNKQGVEALRTLYPQTYAHLMKTVMQTLSDSSTPVPYNRRIFLQSLLNVPMAKTTSMNGLDIAFQQSYAAGMQALQGARQGPEHSGRITTSAARDIEKSAANLRTEAQRLSNPGEQR